MKTEELRLKFNRFLDDLLDREYRVEKIKREFPLSGREEPRTVELLKMINTPKEILDPPGIVGTPIRQSRGRRYNPFPRPAA